MNGERQMGRRTRDVGVGKGCGVPDGWEWLHSDALIQKRGLVRNVWGRFVKEWPPKLRIGGCVFLAGSSTFHGSQRVHWRGKLEDSTRTKIISPTPRPRPRPP